VGWLGNTTTLLVCRPRCYVCRVTLHCIELFFCAPCTNAIPYRPLLRFLVLLKFLFLLFLGSLLRFLSLLKFLFISSPIPLPGSLLLLKQRTPIHDLRLCKLLPIGFPFLSTRITGSYFLFLKNCDFLSGLALVAPLSEYIEDLMNNLCLFGIAEFLRHHSLCIGQLVSQLWTVETCLG
jgi:hypothetical protein